MSNGVYLDDGPLSPLLIVEFLAPIIVTAILAFPVALLLSWPIAKGVNYLRRHK